MSMETATLESVLETSDLTASNNTPLTPSPQTRQRLLEAAAEEFAEHGFRGATVRNICKRAGANIAAVNYHFGDKLQLYTATLQYGMDLAIQQYPPTMGVTPESPVADRLRGFIRGLLYRMLAKGAHAWHGHLWAREMIEPTPAIDAVIRDTVRPMADMLHDMVREIVGPDAPDDCVRRGALSIVGQCCFYRHAREMLTRMYPGCSTHDPACLDKLADHITRFSIQGLKTCGAE